MTPEELDEMDLRYLENLTHAPDMSTEAIAERLRAFSELCDLSLRIRVPHIQHFEVDHQAYLGQIN